MNKTPLVTIITATYNAEKYLEESIISVLNQTYPNFEYIVIDGYSNDGTVGILKNYDSKIKFWISEKDSGIYEAWNKGIERANGEWILFLGADDQLLPNALDNYIQFIRSAPKEKQYDYISSKVKRIRPDGTIENVVGKKWEWSEFKYRMTTAHPGSLHSKKLFERLGNYNTNYQIVSDYEFLLRARHTLQAGFLETVTVLMYTGSRFNDYEAISECLQMQKDIKLISPLNYIFHFININFRHFIKNLIN